MATGTVKWFNMAKRFGFTKPDAGTQDVFVHISAVEQGGFSLIEDMRIEYDLEEKVGAANRR